MTVEDQNRVQVRDVLGVRVHAFTVKTLMATVAQVIEGNGKAVIANVNVHAMNLAAAEPWFRDFLNRSEYVVCDGSGVLLGARLLGEPLPGRITYADWLPELAGFCAERGFSFYFLGAKPGIAAKAAEKLGALYPNLSILGVRHGYFDRSPGSPENEGLLAEIQGLRPNILVTCFGMPLQEKWISANRDRLAVNVLLPGGAAFDYLSGALSRPSPWLRDHGMEWLGRLLIEPRRLAKRYLIGNPLFLGRVVAERIRRVLP